MGLNYKQTAVSHIKMRDNKAQTVVSVDFVNINCYSILLHLKNDVEFNKEIRM